MTTLLILLCVFLLGFLGTALFLWLGARWAKVERATWKRALAATLLITLAHSVLAVLFNVLVAWVGIDTARGLARPGAPIVAGVFRLLALALPGFAVGLLVSWLIILAVFRTSFARAILAWLPTLVAPAGMLLVVFLVVRPFVVEAFIIPTNAMAPTVVGPHLVGVCPRCGHELILPYDPEADTRQSEPESEELGICTHCKQTSTVPAPPSAMIVFAADRFLVNKLLTPRRWDLVVFPSPLQPSNKYVKRLVGLPGEEVVLKDGELWINGARVQPPEEIAPLRLGVMPEGGSEDFWGSADRPARLGPDEYYLIGDFGQRSADSRYWGEQRPVTRLQGVVTVIYSPPSRWRVFR